MQLFHKEDFALKCVCKTSDMKEIDKQQILISV